MNAARPIPNVLSIAGVDPSGGAGILADVKAISANGAYACAVVAALTAQNTVGVDGIFPVPPDFVRAQIDTLCSDVRVDAAKIGMVGQAPVIVAVAERLAHWQPPHVVLDPVMIAKSGHGLLERAAVGALAESLLPLATVITPNLPEAGVLLEMRAPDNAKEMVRCAERLREKMAHAGERWVYLKGGHLPGGAESTNIGAASPREHAGQPEPRVQDRRGGLSRRPGAAGAAGAAPPRRIRPATLRLPP